MLSLYFKYYYDCFELELLIQAADGLPRALNHLAQRALEEAASAASASLSATYVQKALEPTALADRDRPLKKHASLHQPFMPDAEIAAAVQDIHHLCLRYDRERLWFGFLRSGFTSQELRHLVRYLQKEIGSGRRNLGALKLSNLLQLDLFEEDLNISRVRLHTPHKALAEVIAEFIDAKRAAGPA